MDTLRSTTSDEVEYNIFLISHMKKVYDNCGQKDTQRLMIDQTRIVYNLVCSMIKSDPEAKIHANRCARRMKVGEWILQLRKDEFSAL